MKQLDENKPRKENVSIQSLQKTKMKDKTWLIVSIIMGLALIISIGYSLELRKKVNEKAEIIVSRSIVQITASNVSIKNVLTLKGKVEKQEQKEQVDSEESANELINENSTQTIDHENTENEQIDENSEEQTIYNVILNLNEETIKKVKETQIVEINVHNDEKIIKYQGKIIKIEQSEQNNKKVAVVEFNFDDNVKENMEAECTIIIEEAKDVIALPKAAIKIKHIEKKEVNTQDNNELTSDQNSINTTENKAKEEKYVIVVNDDGTTSEVVVETGISDEYYVEITSGLSEGQKVQIEEE